MFKTAHASFDPTPGTHACDEFPGVLWVSAPDRRQFSFVSAYAESLFGYPRADWLTPGFWGAHLHPEDTDRAVAAVGACAGSGETVEVDYRLRAADDRYVWLRDSVRVVTSADGVRQLHGVAIDITDRVAEAESELRDSEQRFRLFLDHATDAFFMHAWDGTILEVNQVACDMLGRTRDELIGRQPYIFDPAVTREQMIGIATSLDAGRMLTVETVHEHKDGRRFPVEVRLRPFWHGSERQAVSTVRDLTESKRLERERIESHSLLRAIVDGTTDAIFLKDLDGSYQMINKAGAAFLGRTIDEVIGRTDAELFSADSYESVLKLDRLVMSTGTEQVREETAAAAGVRRTYFSVKSPRRDADGRVIGLIGISRDVTEVRRLEEQVRQAQKMESVGRLAGGIAHDFNNLLTAILGYTELLLNQRGAHDPDRADLEEIQKAGQRAAALTQRLLAYSRKQVLVPKEVDLNVAIVNLRSMLSRVIRADIVLSAVTCDGPALVKIDPTQLEQVVTNLVLNSRDALPGGGHIRMEVARVRLAQVEVPIDQPTRVAEYIRLSVTDDGVGISPDARAHLFEPFFTTKELGKGTGLGLASVYGIVRQSNGFISVDSEPGHGTTFTMHFPALTADQPQLPAAGDHDPLEPGRETILLVEDEDSVRVIVGAVLRRHGYRVLEAAGPREACDIFAAHGPVIDLLLTDVVMPDMNGPALAQRLVALRPQLRVLFISGYADGGSPIDGSNPNVAAVVVNLTRTPFDYNSRIALIRNLRWIFPDLRIVVVTGNKTMAAKALQWGADSVSSPPGGSWQLRLTIKLQGKEAKEKDVMTGIEHLQIT